MTYLEIAKRIIKHHDTIIHNFHLDRILQFDMEPKVRRWLGANEGGDAGTTRYYYFDLLDDSRKAALLDLAWWGGIKSGVTLKRFLITAITVASTGAKHNTALAKAAAEILWKDGTDYSKGRSGWYEISPTRAEEIAGIIRTGELPYWAKEKA